MTVLPCTGRPLTLEARTAWKPTAQLSKGSRLSFPAQPRLLFCYAENTSYHDAIQQAGRPNATVFRANVADSCILCRQLPSKGYLGLQAGRGLLGGPSEIVRIDESKFGRRKYNRGRLAEAHRLTGIIEDESEDFCLEIRPGNKRDLGILIPPFERHMVQGTLNRTDDWPGDTSLPKYCYRYEFIVHSRQYVSRKGVQGRIVAQWRRMKNFFRGRHVADEHFKSKNLPDVPQLRPIQRFRTHWNQ